MLILKVISRLLDYPSADLFAAADELVKVVDSAAEISPENRQQISDFIRELTERDLFDAQESYDLLFDRGRALSLLLFEHVHGESRDRGQAMVDLISVYRTKGFDVSAEQLPDYIPLYLEFLSEQEDTYAQEWLGDVCHLLAMLAERLKDRDCPYAVLFDTLVAISGEEVDRQEIAESVSKEERDDTVEAIDKEWEDREVLFDDPMGGEGCPSSGMSSGMHQSKKSLDPNNIQHVPLRWHDTDAAEVAGL